MWWRSRKITLEDVIVAGILFFMAMPIIGAYMIFRGDSKSKSVGLVVFIVGMLIWVSAGFI